MTTPTPPSVIRIVDKKPTLTERVKDWFALSPRTQDKLFLISVALPAIVTGVMVAYQIYRALHAGQPPEQLESVVNHQDYTVWFSQPRPDPARYDPENIEVLMQYGDCIDSVTITAGDPSLQAGIPEFADKTPHYLPGDQPPITEGDAWPARNFIQAGFDKKLNPAELEDARRFRLDWLVGLLVPGNKYCGP